MSHYQQSLVLAAKPAAVYATLTRPEGLRGWWTQDCDVQTELGGTHHFRFGPHQKKMRIERLEPGHEVRWRCVDAHIAIDHLRSKDEWVDTQLVFRLAATGSEGTRLDFEHIGLVPALECYGICCDGWRHFLSSLQKFVETGRGTPYRLELAAAQ